MARLAKDAAPQELWPTFVEEGMKDWLAEYLEDDFKAAEFWESRTWLKAREMDEAVVSEMLRVAGLDEMGYVLATEEEMKLQIRWRRDGDWKAGSVPEGRPTMARGVQESVEYRIRHEIVNEPLTELPEAPVLGKERRLTVGAENSQPRGCQNLSSGVDDEVKLLF
jgi:hypothetical protein